MGLTPFGRAVRKYRIDLDVTLKGMADELGWSSAYQSALETGRKPLSDRVVRAVVEFLGRRGIDASELYELAARTGATIDLRDLDEDSRAAIAAFARRISNMPEERRLPLADRLRQLMKEENAK